MIDYSLWPSPGGGAWCQGRTSTCRGLNHLIQHSWGINVRRRYTGLVPPSTRWVQRHHAPPKYSLPQSDPLCFYLLMAKMREKERQRNKIIHWSKLVDNFIWQSTMNLTDLSIIESFCWCTSDTGKFRDKFGGVNWFKGSKGFIWLLQEIWFL